jgi:hypothetical protein
MVAGSLRVKRAAVCEYYKDLINRELYT